ncbi:MAG: hypothetical protein AAGA96_11440 [Verrucomicrobiota bacterium]
MVTLNLVLVKRALRRLLISGILSARRGSKPSYSVALAKHSSLYSGIAWLKYGSRQFGLVQHLVRVEAVAAPNQVPGNPAIVDHLVECPPTATEPLGCFDDSEKPVVLGNLLR